MQSGWLHALTPDVSLVKSGHSTCDHSSDEQGRGVMLQIMSLRLLQLSTRHLRADAALQPTRYGHSTQAQ